MLMLCAVCGEEFEENTEHCPTCECRLVPAELNYSGSPAMADMEFVELCRPRTHPVAMLIKQMLEQNGVPAIVKGANALSVLPHLMFTGELRILVDSQRLEFARAIYRAYFENDEGADFIAED